MMLKPIDFAVFAVKVRALLDRQIAAAGTVVDHGGAESGLSANWTSDRATGAIVWNSRTVSTQQMINLTSQKEELEANFLSSVRMYARVISESGHAKRATPVASNG